MLKWNRLFIDAIFIIIFYCFFLFLLIVLKNTTDHCTRLRVEYFPAKEKGKILIISDHFEKNTLIIFGNLIIGINKDRD